MPKCRQKESNGLEAFQRNSLRKKYGTFSSAQIEKLEELFSKNPYPIQKDVENLSECFNLPLAKIQNWLKYKRRTCFLQNEKLIPNYQIKNVVSQENFDILKAFFEKNRNPNVEEIKHLASVSNMKEKQVISWFTYRRRKIKLSNLRSEKQIPKLRNRTNPDDLKNKNLSNSLTQKLLPVEPKIDEIPKKEEITIFKCKKETDFTKLEANLNIENSNLAQANLNKNFVYNLNDNPLLNNQLFNTNFYMNSLINKYAYSSMLCSPLMITGFPYFGQFDRFGQQK